MVQALRKFGIGWVVLFETAPRGEHRIFFVSYIAFCLLALLTLSEAGEPNPLDAGISEFVHGIPFLRADWCKNLTRLGDGDVIRRGSAIGVFVLMALRKWQYVPALLIGVFGEIELNRELQKTLGRVRPGFPDIPPIGSFGFPSGHTGAATAFYGFWIVFVLREYRGKRFTIPIASMSALVAVGVGLSRIFLLAHWTTDVLGGFAFAITWILFCFWVNERMQSQARTARQTLG